MLTSKRQWLRDQLARLTGATALHLDNICDYRMSFWVAHQIAIPIRTRKHERGGWDIYRSS